MNYILLAAPTAALINAARAANDAAANSDSTLNTIVGTIATILLAKVIILMLED